MRPDAFVRVASLADLAGPGPFPASASGVDVALVRAKAGWRAFDGRCPHQGALLGEGEIEGDKLVCRNHRWRFSIESGQRQGGPERLTSCPLAERDDAIFIDVSGLARTSIQSKTLGSVNDLPGPKGLPLFGNLHQIDPTTAHLRLEEWAAAYGPTYRFHLGRTPVVVTADSSLIDEILRARPETFRRGANTDLIFRELGIDGVFNAEGDSWRAQRKLALSALAQRSLRQLYPNISKVAGRLKTRWENSQGQSLDIVDELKRFTVDVTMLIALGHDVNTVEQSENPLQRDLELVLPAIERRIFSFIPTWRYFKTPADRRLDRASARIRAWLTELAAERRDRLAAEPRMAEQPSNFLDAMLSTVDEHGRPFSDDLIVGNLLTMLLAGEDTTALTLGWAVHHLCDSPNWVVEIRREADTIIGSAPVAETLETVNRLACASAVANETMRLRPVAPIIDLEANVDTAAGGLSIPKGTIIQCLLRPRALDAVNFADPREFRPQRWLNGQGGAHNVSAHAPFGAGPRLCPGRSLALAEMNALLSMLYKSFDVERLGDSQAVSERFGFTMSPAGLRVRLLRRPAECAEGSIV
jgi:cytochrome P450/nitrite reductase/ring-hydroxylating ferredoxin subunit